MVEPAGTPETGDVKAMYTYDYRNRRARKLLYRYSSGQWSQNPIEDTILLYDGWLPVLVRQNNYGMGTTNYVRAYTWGLDLAGLSGAVNSRASAGGIGGLLAVREERDASFPGGDGTFYFLFTHDGTGNVGQVVDLSPTTWDAEAVMVARYEYEPYGGLRSSAGVVGHAPSAALRRSGAGRPPVRRRRLAAGAERQGRATRRTPRATRDQPLLDRHAGRAQRATLRSGRRRLCDIDVGNTQLVNSRAATQRCRSSTAS